ncbi:PHP domain protein [Selenomonas sp. FOBRC6]|uniref:PHP domain-containing protein n=1 Tax=Selenomonas sp. FOBRC6 TaxID=936572 RepID=UPI000277EAFC|nr:PHP domain-containing protein [Selenomonas sp. FOBRC6]EJO23597.1 PHP domain protein [Selenomonas sp. FOBRC6]
MRADYHVHTAFSDDSTYPMEDVMRDAIARGIDELCFTEHVDYGIKKDWDEPGEMPVRKGGVGEPAEMPLANADYPRYYEAVCAMQEKYAGQIRIRFGLEFGAQAHTIPRYDLAGAYLFEKLRPVLTEILRAVIADGKGIELNTSSHRYGLPDLTPSRDILRLYHELGGRIITIGSDSHKPDHLGAYIDEGKAELRALGFREFCTFERMQPIFHAL